MYRWQDLLDKNGNFHVMPDAWKALNESLTRDQVTELLQDAVDNTNMAYPFRPLTQEQAVEDFKRLRYFDASSLLSSSPWTPKYEYKYGNYLESINQARVGATASNYFHQHNRMLCSHVTRISAALAWKNRETRREVFQPLWTYGMDRVTPSKIRSCGGNRQYVAAQFRPSAAKCIYQRFGGGRVLDFSAGWGDRLAAALATESVTHYTGIDPNLNLHPGYRAQERELNRNLFGDFFDWFGSFTPKTVNFIASTAEDADLSQEDPFDLVFTSPPYFNAEKYTNDDTQSYMRYRTRETWLEGFMYPVLRKVWEKLRPGGHLCVNIADVKNYNPSRRVEICDPMNDQIVTLPGAKYQGAMGLKMRLRQNLISKDGRDASSSVSPASRTVALSEVPVKMLTQPMSVESFLDELDLDVPIEDDDDDADVGDTEESSNRYFYEPIWIWQKT